MLVRLGSFNDLLERRNFKKLLLKLVLDCYVFSLVFQMKAGLPQFNLKSEGKKAYRP